MIEAMEPRLLLTTLPTQLPGDIDSFLLVTDTSQTTPGLIGSYVNSNLRSRAIQDDWRVTQEISGTRVDAEINFDTADWGTRSSVGLTGGIDSDWENFSVQWDGFVKVLADDTTLWTRSDDSSRFWLDLNGDGTFDSSGAEFINNHWGSGQATTNGDLSVPLNAGLYRIRLQYEEGGGENIVQLRSGPQHRLRVAYLIPSNREPQPEGVANLQSNIMGYQRWLADQMDRQGFGPMTFAYETEANGVTPRIHALRLPDEDTAYRRADQQDTHERILEGARDVGISPFADGEIWLLVHEAHLQNVNGPREGAVALGGGSGNGSAGGVAVVDASILTLLDDQGLRDDRPYDGLIVPTYGPHPLVLNQSFPWFEGSTISSVVSSFTGAMLHEVLHGFGLRHDSRNDDNFHGNVMGNGLRGWRGYVFPNLYHDDAIHLQRASAVALNASRYLRPMQTFSDNTAPTLTINGAATFVSGQVRISFTASDSGPLLAAVLLRGGDSIGEMVLAGTTVTSTFDTPYYETDTNSEFSIEVFDASGNKARSSVQFTPPTVGNHAPQPGIRASPELVIPGQTVTLSAAASFDIDAGSTLQVEWDTDGDGTFDTALSSNLTLTISYPTPGARLVRARLRDNAGAIVVSAPVPIRTVADLSITAAPVISAPSVVTSVPRPVMSWPAVGGATEYEVWVTKDPSTSIYHRVIVTQTSYTPPVDFGIGKFNLWVRATNGASAGPWTPKFTFVINTAAVLHSITRLQPTLRPTISWNTLPGAARYDVWINDVSRGITQHIRNMNVSGTSFTPTSDLPLGIYRSWVRGIASDGTAAAWSTAIEFVTMQAPTITQGQNPTFDRTPTFAWNALPGAAKYEVFIRNLSTGATTLYEKNITNLNFTPSTPLPDGSYRWWALGVSAQGVRSFWTDPMDIYIGGRTELLTPIGNTNDRTPTFTWRPVDGAVRYDIWINDVSRGISQKIRNTNVTGTSFTPSADLPLGVYRAWVRGIAADGTAAAWSTAIEFVTMQAPTITQGQNPTFDRTPTFAWNALPGAAKYEVFIRNLSTGATALYEKNITNLNFTLSTPLPDGPYRWWALGVSAQGIRSFWTDPMDIYIGGRTELLTPLGNTNERTPTFTWRPVDGAVRYDLFVDLVGGQTQIIREQNLTVTTFSPSTALPVGTYRAWIRAVSSSGEVSPWSPVATFTIVASNPVDDSSDPDVIPESTLTGFSTENNDKDGDDTANASPRRIAVALEALQQELISGPDRGGYSQLFPERKEVPSEQLEEELLIVAIHELLRYGSV